MSHITNEVVLKPMPIDYYTQSTNEPQMIQKAAANKAYIYIDSQIPTMQIDKTNMLLSSASSFGDNANVLIQNVRKISISQIGFFWNTPNINVRNNVIRFYSSVSATYHTVTIPEGFYNTELLVITAIRDALNTVTGASGLTFSFATTNHPLMYDLNSAGGSYYFDKECLAVKKGEQLYCLPVQDDNVASLSNSKVVGSIGLYYTRYIDLTSNALSQYMKLRSSTNGKVTNVLFRTILGSVNPGWFAFNDPHTAPSFNMLKSATLSTIDFTLYDQFGDILYVPPGAIGTNGGFNWDIEMICEL